MEFARRVSETGEGMQFQALRPIDEPWKTGSRFQFFLRRFTGGMHAGWTDARGFGRAAAACGPRRVAVLRGRKGHLSMCTSERTMARMLRPHGLVYWGLEFIRRTQTSNCCA